MSDGYRFRMRMGDMPPLTLLAVPCSICGVAAGMPCLLHSGGLRNEPHIDRKLAAIEAVEAKRIPRLYVLTKTI
jgi:hypothetical protein